MYEIFKAYCLDENNEVKTVVLPADEDDLKGLTLCTDKTVGRERLNEIAGNAYLTQFGVGAEPLFDDYEYVSDSAYKEMGIEESMDLEDLDGLANELVDYDETEFADLMTLLGRGIYDFDSVCSIVSKGSYQIMNFDDKEALGRELAAVWMTEEDKVGVEHYSRFFDFEGLVDEIIDEINAGCGYAEYEDGTYICVERW